MYSHVFMSSMIGLYKYKNNKSSQILHTGPFFMCVWGCFSFLKAPHTFIIEFMGSMLNCYQYTNHKKRPETLLHTGPLKPQMLFVNTATALCPALSSGVNLCAIQTATAWLNHKRGWNPVNVFTGFCLSSQSSARQLDTEESRRGFTPVLNGTIERLLSLKKKTRISQREGSKINPLNKSKIIKKSL